MRKISIFLSLILFGCATQAPKTPDQPITAQDQQFALRNHGYSLLYELLKDEKDVSKLLIVKKEQPDVGALIKKISETAGAAAKQIEALSQADPHLHINMNGLPPAEIETRDLISKTRAKELLAKTGEKFELRILLTQAEALSYGAHLAVVTQSHETEPDRKKTLGEISQQLQDLHQSLIDLMHARWQMPPR